MPYRIVFRGETHDARIIKTNEKINDSNSDDLFPSFRQALDALIKDIEEDMDTVKKRLAWTKKRKAGDCEVFETVAGSLSRRRVKRGKWNKNSGQLPNSPN